MELVVETLLVPLIALQVLDSDPTPAQHHHLLCMPKYGGIVLFLVDVFIIEVVAFVMSVGEDRGIQAQDPCSGEEEPDGQYAQSEARHCGVERVQVQ